MKQIILRRGVMLALAAAAAACTMKETEAPSFTGPSEFGTSVNVTVDPDSIPQNGTSWSTVTVTARGVNGEPRADLEVRADIRVNGILTDFGTLSPRSGRTNAAGKATFVYTAPPTPSGLVVDAETVVQIGVTPSESDFANSSPRFVSLRLLPPGKIQPPSDLVVSFQPGTTTTSTVDEAATFTVTVRERGTLPRDVTIVGYTWNFGDGGSMRTTVPTATYTFRSPGTFLVSVTADDTIGRTGQASSSIEVAGPPLPKADFVFSPTNPVPTETVRFNASISTPSPGRTIASYNWDFGNGKTATGLTPTTNYDELRTYTVTLTVTDDRGRTNTTTKTVSVVKPPVALR